MEAETMSADQLKEKWLQFKGTMKQQWGKFMGNDLQEDEQSYDKIIGMRTPRKHGQGHRAQWPRSMAATLMWLMRA
jgi:uncharacterized protein YjbJ (UPF0337 family)